MTKNEYLHNFMNSFQYTALTFDDVSLVTQFADFLPEDAVTISQLTRNIQLNIPFVSAAMDTVTGSQMATAMAMLGGIGIIHKNLTPEFQAADVRAVKHYLNGLIVKPVTFKDTDTIADLHEVRKQKGYTFSGFPIVDKNNDLVGILTAADIKFARDMDQPISHIMTSKIISAPPGTTVEQAYEIMNQNKIGKLPLVENNKLLGLYSYADVSTLVENVRPMYNRDRDYRLRVGAAIGPKDEKRVELLAQEEVDIIVIDTAHGHSAGVIEMTKWVKKHYPNIDVIAGNIASGEAACALRDAGADAVKVGIGPGSICTTRVVAGVGVPQISAIYECAKALEESIPVIADGGIRHSGDVAKAITAGASTVMMGSILAGTEESPGEKIIYQGRQYVIYRGMGSLDAMKSRAGSRERYGQGNVAEEDLVPEGIEGMVPFAGSVAKVMVQYCGGLQASMGYSGCRTIPELRQRGKFVRVTHAGVKEAHPHDVVITKEAPNYRS